MIRLEDFRSEIRRLYLADPCLVSSIAFWKTVPSNFAGEMHRLSDGEHTSLYTLRDNRLEFYWSDDRSRFSLPPELIDELDFMVLHSDFYRVISDRLTRHDIQECKPLIFDNGYTLEADRNDAFEVADFDFGSGDDDAVAADLLNRCYGTTHHNAGAVANWRSLPVFDKALWIWVKDRANGAHAGLGISTYEADIGECYLDWVQIAPEHQGKGLGRLLLAETIERVRDRAKIIRVTGMADDFYLKCGFRSKETWYVISKR